MPLECNTATSGGKGNRGMFIERDPKIVAAGIASAQATETVGAALQHYLLKDQADALLSDAIFPPPKPRPRPPLRRPLPPDMRNAGPDGQVARLINPPNKTKFESLVADFKDTVYASYWNKRLGEVRDPVPMLPEGFYKFTTFGKPTPYHGRLYDIVMPKVPLPDKSPESKRAGVQLNRNYCSPPYRSDVTYGYRTTADKRGTRGRCAVTDDRIMLGKANMGIVSSIDANFTHSRQPRIGEVLAPNDNISEVPKDYSFGTLKPPDNVKECLAFCEMNMGVEFFRKCLKHLNTVRKGLSTRVLPTFFHTFYTNLKYFDKEGSGWLAKEIVYDICGTKLIRFDPALIEPLLSMWGAFNGSKIEYKIFVRVINYRVPSPEIPKILDVAEDCLDFRTTYTEMVKPGQKPDTRRMAGLPSGRYFDLDYPISPERMCKADRICLPQESDAKSCLCPSILTHLFVSHRDMYQKREPNVIRKVFEAAGENFTDETFTAIWDEAKKLHSLGWVCYETFRQILEKKRPELEKTVKTEAKE
ncbi:hypothetical protein PYW08_007081 [Mythimna loreyi]|uniref:Uncharacterized protein n=1 Tax=Mythimna loreyi TaxID=667449 RepID=A0ACC2R8N6_9NEOP|nr:hypothetical protein PYW08_007081 [Mythimna loreyi]